MSGVAGLRKHRQHTGTWIPRISARLALPPVDQEGGRPRSCPRENSQISSNTFDGKGESAHHRMDALWVREGKVAHSDKRFLLN